MNLSLKLPDFSVFTTPVLTVAAPPSDLRFLRSGGSYFSFKLLDSDMFRSLAILLFQVVVLEKKQQLRHVHAC